MKMKVEPMRRTVHLMGTIIDLLVEHEHATLILAEVVHKLKEYEHRFSANNPASELMQVNQQAGIRPVMVHPELYQLIKLGKKQSCAKDSNLNIAIGPLVQAWRIGFGDAKVPAGEEIETLLHKTNPQHIQLDDATHRVFLSEPGMFIDLGCLAKGYIADLLIDYLKGKGVNTALINLGGNIVGLGPEPEHQKEHWKIGIQDPTQPRNEPLMLIKAVNQSVVTSGIYERNLNVGGQTYHHILDPHTGYPIESDVASLTVQSEHSIDGEIWTTRLYGKPATDIIHYLNQLTGIEGMVITTAGEVLCSKGLEIIA